MISSMGSLEEWMFEIEKKKKIVTVKLNFCSQYSFVLSFYPLSIFKFMYNWLLTRFFYKISEVSCVCVWNLCVKFLFFIFFFWPIKISILFRRIYFFECCFFSIYGFGCKKFVIVVGLIGQQPDSKIPLYKVQ